MTEKWCFYIEKLSVFDLKKGLVFYLKCIKQTKNNCLTIKFDNYDNFSKNA